MVFCISVLSCKKQGPCKLRVDLSFDAHPLVIMSRTLKTADEEGLFSSDADRFRSF